MAATTPLYHAYARLWLPTLAASWVLGGGLVATLFDWYRDLSKTLASDDSPRSLSINPAVASGIAAVAMSALGPMLLPDRVRPFPALLEGSDGIRDVVARFRPLIVSPELAPKRVHLYGRPAFAFYMLEEGIGPIQLHPDLESITGLAPHPGEFIVIDAGQGVTISQMVDFEERTRWQLEQMLIHSISIPTLLDIRPESIYDPDAGHIGIDFGTITPRQNAGGGSSPTSVVWVFRSR